MPGWRYPETPRKSQVENYILNVKREHSSWDDRKRLEPVENPFGPKLLPM